MGLPLQRVRQRDDAFDYAKDDGGKDGKREQPAQYPAGDAQPVGLVKEEAFPRFADDLYRGVPGPETMGRPLRALGGGLQRWGMGSRLFDHRGRFGQRARCVFQ